MKRCIGKVTNPAQLLCVRSPLSPRLRPLDHLQTHSCLQVLQQPAPHHPQIAQRKQCVQLRRVLGQSPIAHLHVPELAFDDPKRVLDLGAVTRFDMLQLVEQGAHRTACVQRTALARAHGHMPVGLYALDFFSFGHPLVASIGEHIAFLTVHQRGGLRHVIDVGGCAHHGVNQPRVGIDADVALHAKVPLLALLGLMHLGVTLAVLVLGRAGRGNQGGVHHRALLEHQALVGQAGVDHGQHLRGQLVLFEQVAKAQDADPVGQTIGAAQACKLPVQRHIEQRLFHGHVRQAKPLLQEVNAQHGGQLKRWAPGPGARGVRRNQRQQLRPRHHQVHLVQEHRLARAPGAQLKAKILLLHDAIVPTSPQSRHPGLTGVLNTIPSSHA